MKTLVQRGLEAAFWLALLYAGWRVLLKLLVLVW